MNKNIAMAIVAAFAVNAALCASQASAKGGHAVLIPAADVKWADVPGFPGVQMGVINGNPAKGSHHSMLKFAAGFAAPLHHHSSDHYGTVVAGTVVLTVDGKENKLPAGSSFALTGRMPHQTSR